MTIHKIEDAKIKLVPFLVMVLDGDVTKTFKEGDFIKTSLVKYKIDGADFDERVNATSVIVKEVES
jgi:hypothetical protein